MRATYDTEADAISIDLVDTDRWDAAETIDDDYCTVSFASGRVANVELLSPTRQLGLLGEVAKRYELDREALEAAAQSAFAAPNRTVAVEILSAA